VCITYIIVWHIQPFSALARTTEYVKQLCMWYTLKSPAFLDRQICPKSHVRETCMRAKVTCTWGLLSRLSRLLLNISRKYNTLHVYVRHTKKPNLLASPKMSQEFYKRDLYVCSKRDLEMGPTFWVLARTAKYVTKTIYACMRDTLKSPTCWNRQTCQKSFCFVKRPACACQSDL